MAMYESEHTKFMREWMAKNPQELEEQKEGRALWWDKGEQDLDTARRNVESKVPQKAYYYDIEG
ncbi:MAG TPA: DUF3460 family protein [Rhodocyclaceae bacterium]|jgi:hypothetical protein|nr:DUF3460 family protein [Rhodocyclaceae bacterium]